MNIRFTSTAILGTIILGTGFAGCSKTAPTPPANVDRPPSAPPTPPPIRVEEKPTAPPTTPPATAPISMKPTDVHPTTAPAIPSATSTAAPPRTGTIPAGDPKVAVFAGLTAPKPVTWAVKPAASSGFVLIKYNVPGRDGADQAEIAVSKAGGTLEANIDRWKGQFKGADGKPVEPKKSNFNAGDLSIILVEFAGSYAGMGGTFKPEHVGLIGIVENPGENVFIKFVGPTATVEANRQAFMDMLNGMKRAEPQK